MPGYGVVAADERTGLLPWSWAEERLRISHDYWLATSYDDGRPHVAAVWGMWLDASLWFSSSRGSRKARNLTRDPRCTITTDNAWEPVIVEGEAEAVADERWLRAVLDAENEKYDTDYGMDMMDPASNTLFRIRPARVFVRPTSRRSGFRSGIRPDTRSRMKAKSSITCCWFR